MGGNIIYNYNKDSNNRKELNLDPELDFVSEFDLSRNGMIKEIETEFNIIRLCLTELYELDDKYIPMFDRILVMPLRKLLCEKNSVLLNVAPDFKMSPLTGPIIELNGKLKITRPSLNIEPPKKWIPIVDWLQKDIAYFDRTIYDLPDAFPEYVYQCILNKLKKTDKEIFGLYYHREEVNYKGKKSVVYIRVNPDDSDSNSKIFSYLEQIGYNHLSINNFLKHQSDKRGAHIDVGHSLVVEIINNPISDKITITLCIALQMINAAKIQIPELANYWPEMPDLSAEGYK
jgi:hypothetical protein